MKKISFLIFVSTILFFTSCVKEPSGPTIEFHSPTASEYNSGDTVWIDVHFEDAEELEEYHVDLLNKTTNSSILHIHNSHAHVASAHVDTFVVLTVTEHTDFELEGLAINHDDLTTIKTKEFHVDL